MARSELQRQRQRRREDMRRRERLALVTHVEHPSGGAVCDSSPAPPARYTRDVSVRDLCPACRKRLVASPQLVNAMVSSLREDGRSELSRALLELSSG